MVECDETGLGIVENALDDDLFNQTQVEEALQVVENANQLDGSAIKNVNSVLYVLPVCYQQSLYICD